MRVFSTGSYSGATTADIAREAGVSEPILYRHFASKRELYFACLDEAWLRLRQFFDEKHALHEQDEEMPEPGEMARRLRRPARVLPPNLWIQALTEAGEDPEIAQYLRRHMRERARLHGRRDSPGAGGGRDRRRPRSRRRGLDLPVRHPAALGRRPPRWPARRRRTSPRSPRNGSAGSPAPSRSQAARPRVHSYLETLSPGAKRPFRGLGADQDLLPQIPILLAP